MITKYSHALPAVIPKEEPPKKTEEPPKKTEEKPLSKVQLIAK